MGFDPLDPARRGGKVLLAGDSFFADLYPGHEH